jgi:ABC-2 type transport system permease protein
VSRDFIKRFEGSPYFSVRYYVSGYEEIHRLMDNRRITLAVVLPFDFSRPLKKGESTSKVQVLLDGTDANTANLVLAYVQIVVAGFNADLLQQRLNSKGIIRMEAPVKLDARMWFNEDLQSINFIVPGLIVVIMTMVGALLTALTVVREVERGSMESLLATPLKKGELLLGKLGPYFFVGMLDMAIVIIMGQFLFEVPLRGSVPLLVGLSSLFLLATLGHGLLISVSCQNQLQAYQMGMLTTFLPAFLLSGFVFAIYLMPWPLQLMSYLVPARYLVSVSKGIYLKGVGMEVLWGDALMLAAAAVLFIMLALRRFEKKIR